MRMVMVPDFFLTDYPNCRVLFTFITQIICVTTYSVQVTRNPCTGEVEGFSEVYVKDAGTTAKNSTSLRLVNF